MSTITIPHDIEIGGSTYYQINIKLPLRSFTIKKRYLEFQQLVLDLSRSLGIDSRDFPYELPGKRINWLNKASIVEERKVGLAEFLNNLIQDSTLQNEREVLSFLQLPSNFRFTKDMLQNNRADLDSVQNNWYDVYRKLKLDILNESSSSISEQIDIRDRISRVYQPRILDLVRAIGTDKEEALKKKQLVSQLQESIDNLLVQKVPRSKRVLGGAVKETPETLPLNNKELLQHQVQIHQNQDKELDQLRVLIARQKQIGELINAEVEEQNEMLDRFNEEVDYTSSKIKQARRRAKKIL